MALALALAGDDARSAPLTGGCPETGQGFDPLALYGDTILFSVARNGTPVGNHRISIERRGAELTVNSSFEITVNVLFFTAYRYRYESSSIWHRGCLVALEAVTNDNGEVSRVEARRVGDELRIEGPSGIVSHQPGLYPTEHWHAGVLAAESVLNTISGKVNRVRIEAAGDDMVIVDGKPHPARRYVYRGELENEVWYDDEGRWVRMRFRAKDGSTIEYECRRCGPPTGRLSG